MNIRRLNNNTEAVKAIANELRSFIEDNANPMWLLSGGSNIQIQIQLSKQLSETQKKKTTVALVDERFGEGSTFNQLKSKGFDFGSFGDVYNTNANGKTLKEAAKNFDDFASKASKEYTWFVQLGYGFNGHVAGNLPETEIKDVVFDSEISRGFVAEDYERITLKDKFLLDATKIIIFASGDKKIEKLEELTSRESFTPVKEIAHLQQTTTYLSEGA